MSAHRIRVFIDAEFSNQTDMHLISLALVSEQGEQFYAELKEYPMDSCTEFVCANVLPLLGRSTDAEMSRSDLTANLKQWLEKVRGTSACVVASHDFIGDYRLLVEALGETPAWLQNENVRGHIDDTVREEYFRLTGLPKHHALNDAQALRYAYRPTCD